jgi:hypothetical protein
MVRAWVDVILKEADVARRSLHQHIDGKDGLLVEVIKVTSTGVTRPGTKRGQVGGGQGQRQPGAQGDRAAGVPGQVGRPAARASRFLGSVEIDDTGQDRRDASRPVTTSPTHQAIASVSTGPVRTTSTAGTLGLR